MSWQFTATQVEPSLGFENWPEGWFPVIITAAEEKPNTGEGDAAGMTWHLSIKGLDGPVKDKSAVIQIPYKNGNQQRMDIAQKTMSAICHVTNVLTFQHPGQLANIPFFVKSGSRKGKGENSEKSYQDWPDFKNTAGETALDIYKRLNGQGGGAPQQQFGAAPQQQQPPQQQQQFGQPQQQPGFQQPPQGQPPQQQWQQPPQGGAAPQGGQPGAGSAWPAQPQGGQPPANNAPPASWPQQGQQQPGPGPAQQPPQQQWQQPPQGGQPPQTGAAPWGAPQG